MKPILIVAFFFILNITNLIAAEAGMPQLDPKYWLSQTFWLILIFVLLYLSISKFFIPKIKDNLDNRENKIDGDLNEAKSLNELSEKKAREYENEINKAKKDVAKLLTVSKKNLDKSIEQKKNIFEKDWLYLCYNCIRFNRYLYGKYFKSQFQNIKSFRRCKLNLSKVVLPLLKVNI